ncbi:hypothetical protein IGS67_13490 [Flavimobilis sp. GY10621]|uniref:Helix-turn-helix domain-containing protein n=1 Tax=Flavimobilis rhizosphaerae TaxID=2775421 RepID=A0ABR9DTZ8_9MICO|nr:hypothetical protein [Flavimobilis rhizosphaerae]MBD9700483.1 hypothetical protein [Flavimobilis rhizosphaerae]
MATMGNALVQEMTAWNPVLRTPAGSPDVRAMLALTFMASTALDRDSDNMPARMYFAGHDRLVYVLGYRDASALELVTDSDRRRVRRAIKTLRDAGAIRLAEHASAGYRTARYELLPRPVDNQPPARTGGPDE